jgi:protein-S-isoprenylcysteine O-methyltransferase Ste14
MSFLTLRHVVEAVAIIVLGRQLQGALRTFSVARGEQPSLALQLFPLANAVVIYLTFTAPLNPRLAIPGLTGFAGSFVLFEWARRTVQGKTFTYAYSNDTPQFLLTEGPFAYIRNPFYTSYLLSYAGAAILFPGIETLVVLCVMALFFAKTAHHEERKFQRSALSSDYEAYRRGTGRFMPKLRR